MVTTRARHVPLAQRRTPDRAKAAVHVTVPIYSSRDRQMRFKVYLLRSRGRRRPWRDVKNGRAYTGTLVSHVEQHKGRQYSVLQLEQRDPMSADRPPPLYEPVLLGFAPLAFRLRGFERAEGQDGGYGVVQEWQLRVREPRAASLLRQKFLSQRRKWPSKMLRPSARSGPRSVLLQLIWLPDQGSNLGPAD